MEREEAIKIIKTATVYTPEEMEALETLIPELKESEDERIRKWIKKEIEDKYVVEGIVNNKLADEAFGWLERQKPAESTALQKAFISSKIDYTLEEKCDASDYADAILPTSVTYGENEEEYKLHKIIEAAFIAGQKKQQPAEWSEEDELMRTVVIQTLERFGGRGTIGMQIDWLKSLRPQPKQERQIKEGDKVRIHCRKDRKEDMITIYDCKVGEVIHVWDAKRNPWGHIGVRLDNGCNNGFYEDELEVLDEPSWKPSEEQMRFLLAVINEPNNAGSESCHLVLKGLYEQLKDLM